MRRVPRPADAAGRQASQERLVGLHLHAGQLRELLKRLRERARGDVEPEDRRRVDGLLWQHGLRILKIEPRQRLAGRPDLDVRERGFEPSGFERDAPLDWQRGEAVGGVQRGYRADDRAKNNGGRSVVLWRAA